MSGGCLEVEEPDRGEGREGICENVRVDHEGVQINSGHNGQVLRALPTANFIYSISTETKMNQHIPLVFVHETNTNSSTISSVTGFQP